MSNGAIEAAAPALWAAAASAHPSNESARAASEQLRQASQWYALICNSWKTAGRLSEYLIHIKDFKEADRMLEASIRRWWWCAAPVEPDPAASMDPEADQAKTVDLAPLHRLGYDWGEVRQHLLGGRVHVRERCRCLCGAARAGHGSDGDILQERNVTLP